ncbi:hypothetical protein BZL30_9226 [Mycobacterium kansasii]|uniref:Uncharacterized protein n=1 Tax=Mycobacterium kansasii TaxID=1768 RepID=A0A1V3WAZ2_MYCKA|nr:hypothetical protein BZL30_9226 [Mycobacterium kansasii]
MLRQLDSGALDNLPASARERLRRDALEVLGVLPRWSVWV